MGHPGHQSMMGNNILGVNPFAAMQNPRNTMMNPYTGFAAPSSAMNGGASEYGATPGGGRPMTMFSSGNPFEAQPLPPSINDNSDPSDDEIVDVIKQYLAAQDLMTLTKRKAREAVKALFPNADMTSEDKTTLINQSIDRILAGGV